MCKIDPRTVRTQEMLKSALFQLLQSGIPLHQISVQKLTKTAGLNRTTFYLHYQDISELRTHLIRDILHVLTEKVENLSAVLDKDRTDQLIQLLDYLQSQREQIIVLAQFEQLEMHLFKLMKKLIITRRIQTKSVSIQSTVNSDIKTASIIGLIIWWLKNGQQFKSETLTEQIHLIYRGN